MNTERCSDRAQARRSLRDATGVDSRLCVEVAYRMTRLRTEAEHERLASSAAVHARPWSGRAWLGGTLVALGRLVEGGRSRETECVGPARA